MICQVCKRDLAPTLSICLTCGAMMNDTVREELQTKISPGIEAVAVAPRKPVSAPLPRPIAPTTPVAPPALRMQKLKAPEKAPIKFDTSELAIKKTSPTLVEFQTRNATLPDWRLKLQNSIRQRKGPGSIGGDEEPVYQKQLVTSGANALQAEYVAEAKTANHDNPRVANALKRIEDSRRAFLRSEPKVGQTAAAKTASRNYPFNVVSKSTDGPQRAKASVNTLPKPKLVSPLRIEKKGYDTNKLAPIPQQPTYSSSLEDPETIIPAAPRKFAKSPEMGRIEIKETVVENEIVETEDVETDEIDDLAPFSTRFTAGVFDCIVGVFASGVLLSPVLLTTEDWLSVSGFLTFIAAFSVVMFSYLTVSIGFYGRTFGMRLCALEIIDAEENAYPTLHQAAVSSAVYLLSLPLLGLGFLPALFNEEKRAAHDILSGTILIREY